MTTNKERIENLEAGLGGLHDAVSRLELGVADKFQQIESSLNRISEALLSKHEASSSHGNPTTGRSRQRGRE